MNDSTIGPYRILRELGRGGMGTVLLAEDTRLGRHVALKTVSGAEAGTAGGRAQLLDEARAAAALSHPAIAAVHDVIEHDGSIAIVFELVEGETLAARLAKGPLPEAQALAIAVQLADALAVAHAQRVLHRDLKPSNVMLAPGGVVKILDFGIARFRPAAGGPARAAGSDESFMGTPGYAPPEQWTGRAVDERADLYALGVVLFEMLTGKRPFPEREPFTLALAAIDRIARRVSSLKPDVSPGVDRLVARLLAADPALRPPRARGVADELRQLLAPPVPPATASWPRLAVAGVLLAVVVGGGVWWTTRTPRLDVRNPIVAVLPLTNATGDSGNDYLVAGVADSLVTSLASLPTVTALSRAVVDDARARQKTPAAVAGDLGATFVVDGTVQRAGDQLRVAISLVRPDGTVAWAEAVEGRTRDLFQMQARLAGAFGDALRVQMSAAEQTRLVTPPTSNANALDAYWRGRALLERRDTPGNLPRAETAFKEALRLDPRFADAHAALAETYWELYNTTRERTWVEQAVAASTNAAQLAPDVPSVRLALGLSLVNSGRNAEAVQQLQRVLAARPNDDEARRYLGRALAALGRLDEALGEWRRALSTRPNNWQALSNMGAALYTAARYDDAIAVYRDLVALQPDNAIGFHMLGLVAQKQGHPDEALSFFQRAVKVAASPPPQTLSSMGFIYHERGEYRQAVEAFRTALQARPGSAATHRNLGDSLLKLGREADARASFRRAADLAEQARVVNPADALNLASLAVYLEKAGDDGPARQRLAEALQRAPADPEVCYRGALVHAVAGRPAEALLMLERAVAAGYSRSEPVRADEFERLRSDPRFLALIGK